MSNIVSPTTQWVTRLVPLLKVLGPEPVPKTWWERIKWFFRPKGPSYLVSIDGVECTIRGTPDVVIKNGTEYASVTMRGGLRPGGPVAF